MTTAGGSPTSCVLPVASREPPRERADPPVLLGPDELEAALRRIGSERYHNLHPFHRRLHDGLCRREEVQAWPSTATTTSP